MTMSAGKKIKDALTIRAVLVGDTVEYVCTGTWVRKIYLFFPSKMIDPLVRLLVLCGARVTRSTKTGKRVLDVPDVTVLESWLGAEVNVFRLCFCYTSRRSPRSARRAPGTGIKTLALARALARSPALALALARVRLSLSLALALSLSLAHCFNERVAPRASLCAPRSARLALRDARLARG